MNTTLYKLLNEDSIFHQSSIHFFQVESCFSNFFPFIYSSYLYSPCLLLFIFFSTFFFQFCGDINKTNSLCQSSSFDTVKIKPQQSLPKRVFAKKLSPFYFSKILNFHFIKNEIFLGSLTTDFVSS